MPANRIVVTGGVWADAAGDAPPAPVEGTTYKDSGLTGPEIDAAWPFKGIVGSAKLNEIMYRLTNLMTQLEEWGVMPWSATTPYDIGGWVMGSNNVVYRSLVNANVGNDPTSSPAEWVDILSIIDAESLGGNAAADYALLASPALTGSPTAPTQAPGDNSTKLATTAYADAISTPFSTTADVTGSRSLATVYTNTSGKPMLVNVTMDAVVQIGGAVSLLCTVGGVLVSNALNNSATTAYKVSSAFMVPPGSTYQVDSNDALEIWIETN